MQPHRSDYWLFPGIEDEQEFVDRIGAVCKVYQRALDPKDAVHVSSSDEKTGIQALEHLQVTPCQKGMSRRVDPEYTRNGTTCLMVALDPASGHIIHHRQGPTRTEEDFLRHVQGIVATDPQAQHIIICDQLNTHKSESLVRWVSQQIGYQGELGKKGRSGILQSMQTRMATMEWVFWKIIPIGYDYSIHQSIVLG